MNIHSRWRSQVSSLVLRTLSCLGTTAPVLQCCLTSLSKILRALCEGICVCKYTDDCTVFDSIARNCAPSMQRFLDSLQMWADSNAMILNNKKKQDMCISFNKSFSEPTPLCVDNNIIKRVRVFKLLGIWLVIVLTRAAPAPQYHFLLFVFLAGLALYSFVIFLLCC